MTMISAKAAIFLSCLLAALAVSLVLTPVVVLLRKQFYVPLIRKKLLQKAIEREHVVQAVLMDEWNAIDPNNSHTDVATSRYASGVYQYEYGGKTYKYRVSTRTALPKQIELYFINNPAKAGSVDAIGLRETSFKVWLGIYFSLVPIVAVVMYTTCMQICSTGKLFCF